MAVPRRPFRETIRDPQFVALAVVFVVAAGMAILFSQQLAPFVIAFILAYFLDGGGRRLTRKGLRRGWALALVFGVFLIAYVAMLVGPLQRVVHRSIEVAGLLNLQSGGLGHMVGALLAPVLDPVPR